MIKMRFNHDVTHTMNPHPVIRQKSGKTWDNEHAEVQMLLLPQKEKQELGPV